MPYADAWLQFLNMAATASTWDVLVFATRIGGWIILFPIIGWMTFYVFLNTRVGKYMGGFQWVLLAIDVPADNVQSPLAVENIFAHLAGGHATRDLAEKYWEGQYQRWFSFEIVSIEGYTQFLIRTEKKYRDLVESAIYAQYPEAEITEVEDYINTVPSDYPNDTHKCWGAEWVLTENHYYPIKTYKMFADPNDKEYFKDPMAALLESFSRIGKGEQMWLQILVKPMGQAWKAKGFEMAKKLMGKEVKKPLTALQKLIDLPAAFLHTIGEAFGLDIFAPMEKSEERLSFGMFALTPGERKTIEEVENKVSKIGFLCKVRAVYVAEKERFDKSRVMYGLVGAIKQFADESSNSLKPDYKITGVSAHYLFIEARKNIKATKIMRAYKRRTTWAGRYEFILNTEELATLWHFPVMTVKTPLLKRLDAKRLQPPSYLPTEIPFEEAPGGVAIRPVESKKGPPPFMSDVGTVYPQFHPKGEPVPDVATEMSPKPQEAGGPPSNLPIV